MKKSLSFFKKIQKLSNSTGFIVAVGDNLYSCGFDHSDQFIRMLPRPRTLALWEVSKRAYVIGWGEAKLYLHTCVKTPKEQKLMVIGDKKILKKLVISVGGRTRKKIL